MRDAQELTVEIDVSKLRKSYLENDDVKKAIEESGIEFSEFEDLINEAMSSTTLNVKLISGSEMKSGQVKGDQTTKESLSVENNSLRTRYLLSMGFAILAIALGIALFWRVRRTPRLLSTNQKMWEKSELWLKPELYLNAKHVGVNFPNGWDVAMNVEDGTRSSNRLLAVQI